MQFKTQPRAHQLRAFEASKEARAFALLMEQGTGKTKVALDTAAYLYDNQKIDALLVMAPNGVHRNWATDEIPVHLPDFCQAFTYVWRADRAKSKAAQALQKRAIDHNHLSIVCFNIESLVTGTARDFLRAFMKARKVMLVVDESTTIKTPGAKRSKLATVAGRLAPYRRILTGTPVTQGPLDLFSQFNFLDPGIIGFTSFFAFKHRYAEWEQGYNGATGRKYETLKGYVNLDELIARIAPHSFRVTKDECLDLPPKVYQKLHFGLNAEVAAFYAKLRDEMVAELSEGQYNVAHVLTRMLRLQQAASNYWAAQSVLAIHEACEGEGCEGCEHTGVVPEKTPPRPISSTNDRLNAFDELLERLPRPAIVWCKFKEDVKDITKLLSERYTFGTYTGDTSNDERARVKKEFQEGRLDFFIGNPRAGGRGLTLTSARSVVYYSHDFSLETRLQSEDRAHRIGQTKSVLYIDMIAENTVDEIIVDALRNKQSLANLITGDKARAWI